MNKSVQRVLMFVIILFTYPCKPTQYYLGSVAKQMCSRYSQETFPADSKCPIINSAEFDEGVYEAQEGEFPHMVQIGYKKEDNTVDWACSGSIISKNFILTTARCLKWTYIKKEPNIVRAGVTNQTEITYAQIRTVAEYIPHPEYEVGVIYDNIALIRVDDDFQFNDYVKPACLFTKRHADIFYTLQNEDHKGINTGWGLTKLNDKNRQNMAKIYVSLNPYFICDEMFSADDTALYRGIRDERMLCGGATTEDSEVCQREYGSPLQVFRKTSPEERKCLYDIVGVAAYSVCGLSDSYPVSIYTRVSHYLEWIEETVWEDFIV